MLTHYIRPEELTAAEVRQVLEFLNGAAGAEEIAAGVEFPGELDVGLGVARRILDRRRALGGRFSDIGQVADVPLVGPERFTEIVAAATGRPLPAAEPSLDALWAEVRELRRAVAGMAGGRRTRITLERVEPEGYVGQPVTLRLRVTEAGKPCAGARVTLASTWGFLQSFVGLAVTAGRAVEIGTDAQGEAKLQLLSPLHDQLTEPQRRALTAAVGRLDRQAATPADTLSGLEHMVGQYRLERNTDLRGAVDLYFQERRAQLLEPVNPRAPLVSWRRQEALVLAYLQEPGADGEVASLASLVVPMKEWLGPWYRVSVDTLESGSGLRGELDRGILGLTDKSLLLERALTSVHSYVAGQRGLAGEAVAQSVADRTLRGFLATGMGALPSDTQLSMFSALDVAARTVRGSGMGALAAVTQARVDLRGEVEDRTVNIQTDLGARVTAVESSLAQTSDTLDLVQADQGVISGRLTEIEADYGRFQSDYQSFSKDYGDFRQEYTQFGQDYSRFNQDHAQFGKDYGSFNEDYAQFSKDRSRFNQDYKQFGESYARFSRDYEQFGKDYGRFNQDRGQFAQDYSRFNQDYAQFGESYSRFDRNYMQFGKSYSQFGQNYGRFSQNYTKFNADYAKFKTEVVRVGGTTPIRGGGTPPIRGGG